MATRTIAFKLINSRKVSFAPLATDLAIGYTDDAGKFVGLVVIPDFLLKKSPTKGYYFSGPSKPFMKNGEQQVDDNGYKRYLEFFKLYSEKGAGTDPEKYSPTKAAFEFRKYLIGLMVDELNKLGGEDAAPAARKPAARTTSARPSKPVAAVTVIDDDEVGIPGMDDEDLDEPPF